MKSGLASLRFPSGEKKKAKMLLSVSPFPFFGTLRHLYCLLAEGRKSRRRKQKKGGMERNKWAKEEKGGGDGQGEEEKKHGGGSFSADKNRANACFPFLLCCGLVFGTECV